MPKRSASYDDFLIQQLKNPDFAREYLNEAILSDEPGAFYLAIRNVVQAQDSMANVANNTKMSRESLYKSFSGKRKPEFETIHKVLDSLGYKLAIQ